MLTRFGADTLKELSGLASELRRFLNSPVSSLFFDHSPKKFEDVEKQIEAKKRETPHFVTVVLSRDPQVVRVTEASRKKVAEAIEKYVSLIEKSFECLKYHVESGEFPPGFVSVQDCVNVTEGDAKETINEYIRFLETTHKNISLRGTPVSRVVDLETEMGKKKEDGEKKEKKKVVDRDFYFNLKGKGLATQIALNIKKNPLLKKLRDAETPEEAAEVDVGPSAKAKAIKDTYIKLFWGVSKAAKGKRYNTFLDQDTPQAFILGSVIATRYKIGKATKKAAKRKDPRIIIKEAAFTRTRGSSPEKPDKQARDIVSYKGRGEGRFLLIRNIPMLGILSKSEPTDDQILKAKKEIIALSSGGPARMLTRQRQFARNWDPISEPRQKKGHYYYLMWPRSLQKLRTELKVYEWDFNAVHTNKAFSILETF